MDSLLVAKVVLVGNCCLAVFAATALFFSVEEPAVGPDAARHRLDSRVPPTRRSGGRRRRHAECVRLDERERRRRVAVRDMSRRAWGGGVSACVWPQIPHRVHRRLAAQQLLSRLPATHLVGELGGLDLVLARLAKRPRAALLINEKNTLAPGHFRAKDCFSSLSSTHTAVAVFTRAVLRCSLSLQSRPLDSPRRPTARSGKSSAALTTRPTSTGATHSRGTARTRRAGCQERTTTR